MAKVIVWNKKAIDKLNNILEYWDDNYSHQSARKLLDQVYERIEVLSRYPEIGRKSKQMKTVRMVTVSKRIQLFYRVSGKRLIIVYLSNSRQNPSENPYL